MHPSSYTHSECLPAHLGLILFIIVDSPRNWPASPRLYEHPWAYCLDDYKADVAVAGQYSRQIAVIGPDNYNNKSILLGQGLRVCMKDGKVHIKPVVRILNIITMSRKSTTHASAKLLIRAHRYDAATLRAKVSVSGWNPAIPSPFLFLG